MRHKSSKVLYEYWNNLRGARPAPERSEIEPSDLRHVLGDTFILEVDTKLRTISFRLAGTRLCSAYGKELKGYGFLCMWNDEANLQIVRSVGKVYRDSQAALFSYYAETQSNRELEYEMILLPLLSSQDNCIRTLGVATPKTSPFWLGSDHFVQNRLQSTRIIDPSICSPHKAPGLVPTHTEMSPVQGPPSQLTTVPPIDQRVSSSPLHNVDNLGAQRANAKQFGHLMVLDGGRDK